MGWKTDLMNETRTPTYILAKAIGIAIVIGSLIAAGYVAFVKAPTDLGANVKDEAIDAVNKSYDFARRIGKDIDNAINFRPRITTEGITILESSGSIAELSTVEKRFEHTHSWQSTWMGSTKRIELKGLFVAKAGYDLTKPFSIDVSDDLQTIRATMPPAQLNSVEQLKVEILRDEDGLWNKISSEERQSAMNALLIGAKSSLDATGLLKEADLFLMARLESAIRKSASPEALIIREPLR